MSKKRILILLGGNQFTPSDFSDLDIWLDASDETTIYQDSAKTTLVTADSDPVGCWADKSGNGQDFIQATADNRPEYRLGATAFPVVHPMQQLLTNRSFIRTGKTSQKILTGTVTARAVRTVFIVTRNTKMLYGSSNGVLSFSLDDVVLRTLSSNPYGWAWYYVSDGDGGIGGIKGWNSETYFNPACVTVQINSAAECILSSQDATGFIFNPANVITTSTTQLLGGKASYVLPSDIYELIEYGRALTDTEISKVRNYLVHKYSIHKITKTWDLPWISRQSVLYSSEVPDQAAVQEPTVIYDTNPQILTEETNVFKMWFTQGFDVFNTCYAESVDGITWTRGAGNVIADSVHNFVLKVGSTYYAYVRNTVSVKADVYTSSDGVTWTLQKADIVAHHCSNSCVAIDGSTWHMIYESGSPGVTYHAISTDGINWVNDTAAISLPLCTIGSGGVLYKVDSTWYFWSHVGNEATAPTDIVRYSTTDFVNWTCLGYFLMRKETDEGLYSGGPGQIADVSMVHIGSQLYCYYTATTHAGNISGDFHIKLAICDDEWLTRES